MLPAGDSSEKEKIELFISCRNLRDTDTFTKSDPRAKVYLITRGIKTEVGKTEHKKNDLNPDFKKSFIIEYIFEVKQVLRVEVFDHDGHSKDDPLGQGETTIGNVMGSKNQVCTVELTNNGKKAGSLIIKADKVQESNQFIWWQWAGVKLVNTGGFFDKSDPFLRFFKKGPSDWLMVKETESIHDSLDPIWKPFEILSTRLAPQVGDVFRVECWDKEKSGKHVYMGGVELTPKDIFVDKKALFEIKNEKKGKSGGSLKLIQSNLIEKPSFLDFLRGGEQINMIVAVDFTGSNGDPSDKNSLHFLRKDGGLNQYQTAIIEVCSTLLNYDWDKRVPVWGFGGKPQFPTLKINDTSHCFNLTGNPAIPEVLGVEGIMECYRNALTYVKLSGPTLFSHVLKSAISVASENVERNIYTVLLILTDGEIHDKDETMQLLLQAAKVPLSIIIIGVGDEDFATMEFLDGDDQLKKLAKSGQTVRDLVQFVAFNEYKNDTPKLAQEVLAELPSQLVNYKMLVGKKPNPPMMVQMQNF